MNWKLRGSFAFALLYEQNEEEVITQHCSAFQCVLHLWTLHFRLQSEINNVYPLCVCIHYYHCPPKIKREEANVLWAMLFFPYTIQSASILSGCACVLSRGEGQLCGTDCGFPWISCFSASGRYLLSILTCATSLGPEIWAAKHACVTEWYLIDRQGIIDMIF